MTENIAHSSQPPLRGLFTASAGLLAAAPPDRRTDCRNAGLRHIHRFSLGGTRAGWSSPTWPRTCCTPGRSVCRASTRGISRRSIQPEWAPVDLHRCGNSWYLGGSSRPAMRWYVVARDIPRPSSPDESTKPLDVRASIALAVAIALVATAGSRWPASVPLVIAALAAVLFASHSLLPAGTIFRRRGQPSSIAFIDIWTSARVLRGECSHCHRGTRRFPAYPSRYWSPIDAWWPRLGGSRIRTRSTSQSR